METTKAAVFFWMDIHDHEGRTCRIEQLSEEKFGLLADMLSSTELAFDFGRMGEEKSQGGCLLRSREVEGAHILPLEVPSEMDGLTMAFSMKSLGFATLVIGFCALSWWCATIGQSFLAFINLLLAGWCVLASMYYVATAVLRRA